MNPQRTRHLAALMTIKLLKERNQRRSVFHWNVRARRDVLQNVIVSRSAGIALAGGAFGTDFLAVFLLLLWVAVVVEDLVVALVFLALAFFLVVFAPDVLSGRDGQHDSNSQRHSETKLEDPVHWSFLNCRSLYSL